LKAGECLTWLSEATRKVVCKGPQYWAKAWQMAKSAGKGAAERLRAGYNFFSGALPLPFAGVGGYMHICIYVSVYRCIDV